jgi:tetratricopeptide (TPR) repeat protein
MVPMSVGVLLDKTAPLTARDEAALDLGTADGPEALRALLAVAGDPSEPAKLLESCGESIAGIWFRNAAVDDRALARLSERSRTRLLRTLDALQKVSIEEENRSRDARQIGAALLKSGDYAGAIEALEASAALEPHAKTLELLGEAWMLSGEPLRAVAPLAAATTLNAQARAPSLLAEALLAIGDELKAHEIARLALGRDAGNRQARTVFDATKEAFDRWSAL